jgi:co-chaperonin GroES (HSP10)
MKKLQNNLVLVRVDEAVDQDDDGIYIQEQWITLPPTGVVEMVGIDVNFCKKGDKVMFERYSAIEVPTDKNLRLCREKAILATL